MSTDPGSMIAPGFVDRVKNILLKPGAEFDRIAGEPADTGKLYMGYLLPLAAFAAICMTVGLIVFGMGGFGFSIRVSLMSAIVMGLMRFIMAFVGAYVLALIINALAPSFGSTQDQGQAHKLSVYSSTAGLLAGVFALHPQLSVLGILGLYSAVLLYLGLPRLMKTPEDKRIGYFATIIVVAIVVFLVLGVVLGAIQGAVGGGLRGPGFSFNQSQSAPQSQIEGQVTLPGGATVDLGELEKMGQAYSDAAAASAAGAGAAAVDPMRLQALLPETLPGGFARTSISSASTGAMGLNASQAEAEYQRGQASMRVNVVHMGAMGGLASMAGAMGVQENRQDADGYSRTSTVDGRVITEQTSRGGNSASYGVVGRGVAITAEGNGVTVDEARAAVESVGIARAEALGG